MANLGFFHHPICLSSPYRTTTINHHHRYTPLRQTKLTFKFSANSQLKENNNTNNNARESQPPTLPTVSEKKSFAVATGELFIGIASRFIKSRNPNINAYGGNDTTTLLPAESEILRDPTEYVSGRLKSGVGRMAEDAEFVIDPVLLEKDFNEEKDMKKKLSSPGFSFSAAGLLFPYHLGVAKFLIENGYIKETTPLAGSSAGAIVCAVIASGSSMQEALDATKILAADCRLKGTAFRLGAVLRDVLEKFLPDDVHIRSNGRVRVAVTQILWRPRSLLIDQFDSKEDLINAVFTSSFIPGYLAPRPATLFRNRLCVDGGLTLFMPPTSAAKTVRVCAFPTVRLGLQGIGISPDCNPENRATPRELFKWALEPADDDVLDRLFELGYLDAAVWAEQNQVTEAVEDISTTADLLN